MSCDKLPTCTEAIVKEKLAGLTQIDNLPWMYKVHKQLRDVNEKAYKPVLLAIGPFNDHHEVGEGFMEEHKLRYLQQLLKRTKTSVEKYITIMRKWEETTRKCYVQCNVETYDVVQMMLLDGCFIIELFHKYEIYWTTGEVDFNDPIFRMKWVLPRIARDLLLFENQLPLLILHKLFEISESNESRNSEAHNLNIEEKEGIIHGSSTSTTQNIQTRLSDLALLFFSTIVPFKWNADASSYDSKEKIMDLECLAHKALTPSLLEMVRKRLKIGLIFKNAEFEHLLGLIHASICISILDTEIDHAKERQEENIRKSISSAIKSQKSEVEDNLELNPFVSVPLMAIVEEDLYKKCVDWSKIPNGFELLEAGIELDKATKFQDLFNQNRNEDRCERGLQMDGVKLQVGEKFLHMFCLNIFKNWKSIPYGKELRDAGIEFNKAKKFKHLHALQEIESWNIHGATELEEAGIKFKKAEKCNTFSIMFNNGIMEISPLRIEDPTEAFLRNLIAYEQYYDKDDGFDYVYNYVCFMDNLINSPKDVELLRRKGIILNWMGDDEIISSIVNKLGHNINWSSHRSIYARTSKEVNMHCRKRRNRWMAKLRRDYFNTHWAWISFIAAVLLLGLTIVQTIFSIIP